MAIWAGRKFWPCIFFLLSSIAFALFRVLFWLYGVRVFLAMDYHSLCFHPAWLDVFQRILDFIFVFAMSHCREFVSRVCSLARCLSLSPRGRVPVVSGVFIAFVANSLLVVDSSLFGWSTSSILYCYGRWFNVCEVLFAYGVARHKDPQDGFLPRQCRRWLS